MSWINAQVRWRLSKQSLLLSRITVQLRKIANNRHSMRWVEVDFIALMVSVFVPQFSVLYQILLCVVYIFCLIDKWLVTCHSPMACWGQSFFPLIIVMGTDEALCFLVNFQCTCMFQLMFMRCGVLVLTSLLVSHNSTILKHTQLYVACVSFFAVGTDEKQVDRGCNWERKNWDTAGPAYLLTGDYWQSREAYHTAEGNCILYFPGESKERSLFLSFWCCIQLLIKVVSVGQSLFGSTCDATQGKWSFIQQASVPQCPIKETCERQVCLTSLPKQYRSESYFLLISFINVRYLCISECDRSFLC